MSHRPKLEIYKLRLIKKEEGGSETFRNLFRSKLDYSKIKGTIAQEDIFKVYHGDFVKKINKDSYTESKAKKKGFTLAYDEDKGKKTSKICSPISSVMILDGLLEGGKYGLKRSLGKILSTTEKSPIHTDNIVNDRYYFLIYTPLDSSYGYLFIQSYSEVKISDVFKKYIQKYFSYGKDIKCEVEIFVPKKIKDEYLDGAVLKKVIFTTDWHVDPTFQGQIKGKDFELSVKIEITDKSKKKSESKDWGKAVSDMFSGKFSFGKKEKTLNSFNRKVVKIENHGREHPIVLDDMEVQPVIYLDDQGIKVADDGTPDFGRIESYCRQLLKDLSNEIDPSNAVQEL